MGVLSNTGPDPLINHKASMPGFNVGPSSARQRNAISMEFRWRANDDQQSWTPPTKFFGSAHDRLVLASSADPDKMQNCAAFYLGFHGLSKYPFREFRYTKGLAILHQTD